MSRLDEIKKRYGIRLSLSLEDMEYLFEAAGLVEELYYDDQCDYDHHGYCQAHNLQEAPCPHSRARKLLGVEAI